MVGSHWTDRREQVSFDSIVREKGNSTHCDALPQDGLRVMQTEPLVRQQQYPRKKVVREVGARVTFLELPELQSVRREEKDLDPREPPNSE